MSATAPRRTRRGWTQITWNQRARAQRFAKAGDDGRTEDERIDIALAKGTGYSIFSTLIAGMIAYGGIGWLIGKAVGIQMLFPIGMLVGLAISLAWIIYRYGVKGGEL
jgi:F0F1-type ATP synthase assembly protein I